MVAYALRHERELVEQMVEARVDASPPRIAALVDVVARELQRQRRRSQRLAADVAASTL